MRPALVFVISTLAATWGGAALANGGGYTYGVTFTGSVAPFQASGTEQVRIEEEQLDVLLRRSGAAVAVRYTMRNVAARPVRVRFGFPVEAIQQEDGEDAGQGEARRSKLREALQQLQGYGVKAGGRQVEARLELEPFATGAIPPFPGSEALAGIAGWMVSEVEFPAGATLPVEIAYSAEYAGSLTYVSDDVETRPLTFTYRLSTGAVWNGTIGKGTVTIRADGIPPEEVELVAPRDRFRREGDAWRWSFQDLEPTLADDLVLRPIPGFSEVAFYEDGRLARGDRSTLERGGRWGLGHQRFRARASSTLAANRQHDFRAAHLAEQMPPAPWAEGAAGPGIGEWVELEALRPSPLLALQVWSGFPTPELFPANGRPARLEVLLNGEHRFAATLGDGPGGQLIPVAGYSKPVSRIRLTILELYPGNRFADTCIDRVVLYDLLTTKPRIKPAR